MVKTGFRYNAFTRGNLRLSLRSDGSDQLGYFSEWCWEMVRIRAFTLQQIWLSGYSQRLGPHFKAPSPAAVAGDYAIGDPALLIRRRPFPATNVPPRLCYGISPYYSTHPFATGQPHLGSSLQPPPPPSPPPVP
jgi:hypothetical protein